MRLNFLSATRTDSGEIADLEKFRRRGRGELDAERVTSDLRMAVIFYGNDFEHALSGTKAS